MLLSDTALHSEISPPCLHKDFLFLPVPQTMCGEHAPTYSLMGLEDEFTGLQVKEGTAGT